MNKTAACLVMSVFLLLSVGHGLIAAKERTVSGEFPQSRIIGRTQNISTLRDSAVTPQAEPPGYEGVQPMTSEGRAGEEIKWDVLASGGNTSVSGNIHIGSTIGQTAVGISIAESNYINHGFWQDFGSMFVCDCTPGDFDDNGDFNVLDIVYLINYFYKDASPAEPYELCQADSDPNCDINVLDIVFMINYQYKDGPEPPSCEEWVDACGLPLRK